MIEALIITLVMIFIGPLLGFTQAEALKHTKFSIKQALQDSLSLIICWLIVDIVRGSYNNLGFLAILIVGLVLGEYLYIHKYF